MDSFLLVIKSSDFFPDLVLLSHFLSHRSRILSVDFSSILLTLVYVSDYHSLFIKNGVSLSLQSLPFRFKLLKALFVLLLIRFFQKFFGLFRCLRIDGDVVFVPVEFGSLVSWGSFLLRSLALRFLFELFFLLLMFLLNFFLVLRLFLERLGRVDKTLLDVFLKDVFWHIYYYSDVATAIIIQQHQTTANNRYGKN
jgi:hypothetical protein